MFRPLCYMGRGLSLLIGSLVAWIRNAIQHLCVNKQGFVGWRYAYPTYQSACLTHCRFKILLSFFLLFFPLLSYAHTPSSSYLFITELENKLQLRWDIALRDLDYVLGLDSNQNQSIDWQELKNKQTEITAYAFSNLMIQRGDKACQLSHSKLQVVTHTDGSYAVLNIQPNCITQTGSLTVNYSLLFDIDANHRGVILDQRQADTNSYIASADERIIKIKESPSTVNNFVTFIKQGIWHILIGFDHILFVITLMLPAVLLYREKKWVAVNTFKPAFISLLKMVTAFTVAHSITLSLATLGLVSLPSKWVESIIAVSVILVAINNIKPMFTHARWSMAFVFGLIHGFGFASVLSDLNLNNQSLLLSLLGFNVGVELGQGLILMLFFPLAYSLRKTQTYQTVILKGGSVVISLVATFWVVQRVGG